VSHIDVDGPTGTLVGNGDREMMSVVCPQHQLSAARLGPNGLRLLDRDAVTRAGRAVSSFD
jgi:hypothetical protein